jgi:hypothetical protein
LNFDDLDYGLHWPVHHRTARFGALVSCRCRMSRTGRCPIAVRATTSRSGRARRIGALVSAAEIFLDRISVFIEFNYLRPNCELSIPLDKSNIKANCYLSMNKYF